MTARRAIAVGIVAAVCALAAWLWWPSAESSLASRPDPAATYAEAVRRIEAIYAEERTLPLIADGGSMALLHGRPTPGAVVIYHGYTTVPYQWRAIARGLYDAGYNVWMPRMKAHGLRDRMTPELGTITADDLRAYADAGIDIGAGLSTGGVHAAGMSGGGTLAQWALTERSEVTTATAISPLMHPVSVPVWAMRPFERVAELLPPIYQWWDPAQKEALQRPAYAYPRLALNDIAAFLRMGERVRSGGTRNGGTGALVLVVNPGDPDIDGSYNARVAGDIAGPRLTEIRLSATPRLGHDLVTPDGENADEIEVAYRALTKAFGMSFSPTATAPPSP